MNDSGFTADTATRRLILVSGDQAQSEAWVVGQLSAKELGAGLWVAETAPAGIQPTPAGRVTEVLGAEYRLLVFNAYQGFHPDAFAAAVGTLRGGGDCVVLAPALDAWPAFADPDKTRFACYPRSLRDMRGLFLERLVRLWRPDVAVCPVNPDDSQLALRVAGPPASEFHLTAEQQDAVAAIERVAHGHARRPLVLTADRGRGKSTVLGVAAARLLQGGLARVTVVAPGRAAVATLFRHALAALGRDGHAVADIEIGGGILCFRLPSECMTTAAKGLGLVLVDEAAAIPVAVLNRLLAQSNRLVFSSTVHGYEGSGRGFDLRFRSLLQQAMPQWHGLHLSAPVRWPEGDPLEALLNASFLLDAGLNDIDTDQPPVVERIAPSTLVTDERLLRSTFGLLINAHYQTRPSDLRQLLDNPDVHLWLARAGGTVVGVLLASAEGGFDQAMALRVLSGERRPRGHLLPQSLAVHAGLDPALRLSTLRVQRIAVHPQLRRRGIGQRLLEALAGWATDRQFDLLGCAYGVDLPLLAFWQVAGFVPVRLGVRVDPASAAHSLFMLRGLSQAGRDLALLGQRDFHAALPWSLAASLKDLDSRLAVVLLNGRDCADLAPSPADRRALERIASGTRQPATAEAAVWKSLVAKAAAGESPERLAALIAWSVQGRSLEEVCRTFSVAGRKALEIQLQDLLSDR
jgi:tRNA(Met) cytidine acetyltransferase